MDIIQEIKKCQEKIDANTERIFKLQQHVSKYNDLASKYNELASAPFIISGSENENPIKRRKLFI